jgi:hypothetical protein
MAEEEEEEEIRNMVININEVIRKHHKYTPNQ